MNATIENPSVSRCADRVRAEYEEMPGLSLTKCQLQRLLGVDKSTCDALIESLLRRRIVRKTADETYVGCRNAY